MGQLDKVPFKDCIEFSGKSKSDGYGMLYDPLTQKTRHAHRVIWEWENGPLPKGMCIMHICDNRMCINLKHLKLGTFAENIRDMHKKGRWCNRKGEKHPLHKLSESDVRKIRKLAMIMKQKEIAKLFKVRPNNISRIVNFKRWNYA